MAVKEIIKMGHPLLSQAASPVMQFNTPDLAALIQDMLDTMLANNGAGLAAPQIGVSLRVVIFGVQQNPRYPDAETVPQTVLINPAIEVLDTSLDIGWEGCLSVPGLRGQVPRHENIRYRGFDQLGQAIERVAHGFHARVVQHEVDHLNGILYPQRMTDLRSLGFEDTLLQQGILKFPLPAD